MMRKFQFLIISLKINCQVRHFHTKPNMQKLLILLKPVFYSPLWNNIVGRLKEQAFQAGISKPIPHDSQYTVKQTAISDSHYSLLLSIAPLNSTFWAIPADCKLHTDIWQ